jgi:hypothetical protein
MADPVPRVPPGRPDPAGSFGSLAAFQEASRALGSALTAAMGHVAVDPATALAELDAAWAAMAGLEATGRDLAAAMGAGAGLPAELDPAYGRAERLTLLEARFAAAHLLGSDDELARTASLARAVLADQPGHPFWADLMEEEAELTGDVADRERRLDAAFALRLASGAFLAAARNRMRAAALAGASERITRLRVCADQAIAVADAHGLRRESFAFRTAYYGLLLVRDRTGATGDALRAELDFTSRLQGALPRAVELGYAEALARIQGADPREAARTAEAFGLPAEARALTAASAVGELEAARAGAEAALGGQRDAQWLELLLLAAQFKGRFGDWDTPIEAILPMAATLAGTPEARCKVFSAFADAWESLGDLPRATEAAAEAARAAAASAAAGIRAQADARLRDLRGEAAAGDSGIPDPGLDPDDFIDRRIPVAVQALRAGRPARALAILAPLPALAREEPTRGRALMLRGTAQFELARVAEAEADFAEAGRLFEAALGADPTGAGSLLGAHASALLLRAVALTRLGRPVQAWDCAEQSRSRVLRHRLGIPPMAWDTVRAALARDRAAIVTLSVLHWGTLVLSAAPGEAEPQALLLDGLHARDLNRLLDADLADDSEAWTGILMGAAAELSALLMPGLCARLAELAQAADILYFIPDGLLYRAPFPALALEPGRTLAELAPCAILPFAGLLVASGSAEAPRPRTRALLMAAGQDSRGAAFAAQLATLAPALAGLSVETLADELATPEALRARAPGCDLLALACHGRLDGQVQAPDRASSLALGGETAGTAVTAVNAQELADWRLGPGLRAPSLTFLNACQSGRFRPLSATELGGFPAAFLRAGRRTVIAPLTHVDPQAAGALGAALFAALGAGQGAARALQSARLALKAAGAPAADWAAHQMFGIDG